MDETQERKQEELGADEETPVKITATKTDSESEDSFPIQPILKYPVGKKTHWINILQFLLHKELTVLQTYPQAHILQILQVNLHHPLTKSKKCTAENNPNRTLSNETLSKSILRKTLCKEISNIPNYVHATNLSKSQHHPLKQDSSQTKIQID